MDISINDSVIRYMQIYKYLAEKKIHYLIMGAPKQSDNRKALVEEAVPEIHTYCCGCGGGNGHD